MILKVLLEKENPESRKDQESNARNWHIEDTGWVWQGDFLDVVIKDLRKAAEGRKSNSG